jgi:hypothetical protein
VACWAGTLRVLLAARDAGLLVPSDMKPFIERICDQEEHMVAAEFTLEDSKLLTVVSVYNPVDWQHE